MIPNSFDYVRPESLTGALATLKRHGDSAKLLAGGHSLLPSMKLRLAAPATLIDINSLAELHGISATQTEVVIGAATTHATIEHDPLLARLTPLLPIVAATIADATVRNRGTLGGALAHGDPSADWPAAMMAANATFDVAGQTDARSIPADRFFRGLFDTALQPDEILIAVRMPIHQAARVAYRKFRHPASGYAVVGVAVVLENANGTVRAGRIAITGFATNAYRLVAAEQLLPGYTGEPQHTAAIVAAAFNGPAPLEDSFANADYRLQLARTLLRRALADAIAGPDRGGCDR